MKPGTILLAHGSGGRLMLDLVRETFLPRFRNPVLATLTDSAILPELPPGRPAFTTDAFVVDPVVFPGGDLGYLSVCGTVNDLAVAGARPLWVSWALILEEGLDGGLLETFVSGAALAAAESGVRIAAGDTKVVPRGKGDKAYAVTAGIGVVPPGRDAGDHRILPGDAILASGSLAEHGATVLACRHDLAGEGLASDCAPVASLVEALFESGAEVHALHDPTRGGVATTTNEVAGRTGLRILLEEDSLPVTPPVSVVCEVLGLDPLYLASEGRFLAWVRGEDRERALGALHRHPAGRHAVAIGRVETRREGDVPVVVRTLYGGERPLDLLSGMDLPRIC